MTRPSTQIDFGITTAFIMTQAYTGAGYYKGRATKNLRLLAHIEDPYYLLVAVKASSGITSLDQLKDMKQPLKILVFGPSAMALLQYYGLDEAKVKAMGGSIGTPIGVPDDTPFDLIVTQFGAPTNNPESSFWTVASRKYDLRFLELPEPLIAHLAGLPNMMRVTAPCCVLKGFTGPLNTVGWSGDAIFGPADMPEKAAYDIAKAIDQNHGALKWYVRPFSYDPATVWRDPDMPLHPGALRYYKERGYLPKSYKAAAK